MNYYLASYIDFIQSIGFISVFVLVLIVTRKLYLDNKKDNYIKTVKIRMNK